MTVRSCGGPPATTAVSRSGPEPRSRAAISAPSAFPGGLRTMGRRIASARLAGCSVNTANTESGVPARSCRGSSGSALQLTGTASGSGGTSVRVRVSTRRLTSAGFKVRTGTGSGASGGSPDGASSSCQLSSDARVTRASRGPYPLLAVESTTTTSRSWRPTTRAPAVSWTRMFGPHCRVSCTVRAPAAPGKRALTHRVPPPGVSSLAAARPMPSSSGAGLKTRFTYRRAPPFSK